jgi:hypothetical protein
LSKKLAEVSEIVAMLAGKVICSFIAPFNDAHIRAMRAWRGRSKCQIGRRVPRDVVSYRLGAGLLLPL